MHFHLLFESLSQSNWKVMNKYGLFARAGTGKTCLCAKNILAGLRSVKLHLKKQKTANNHLWTDQAKVEMIGHNAHRSMFDENQHTSPHTICQAR